MLYKFQFFVSFMFCIVCTFSGCNKIEKKDTEPEWVSNTYPEYDQERQVIYYKEELEKDIKGDIYVPLNINNNTINQDITCEFSFFNYGENIRLFNGYIDDVFINNFGTIYYAYVVKIKDDIKINSIEHNTKYGDWALVDLAIGSGFVYNVYMTPLSMKAYKNGNQDGYIFFQFVNGNKHMNVIFYGGPEECIIVSSCPNVILPRREYGMANIDGLISGPGQFWYPN